MKQSEIILDMLRKAGARGVTNKEFYRAYLPRYNAVIFKLNKKGYSIKREQIDYNTHLWKLIFEPKSDASLFLSTLNYDPE